MKKYIERQPLTRHFVLAMAAIAVFVLGATAVATADSVADVTTREAERIVEDQQRQLGDRSFQGDVSAVPGLLMFTGRTPDADLGEVNITTYRGSVEEYAASFLEVRSAGLEDAGAVAKAHVSTGDGVAYGSSGETVFAVEWAAVQRGDNVILLIRATSETDAGWIGETLVDRLLALAPGLEASSFEPVKTVDFPFEGVNTADIS